MSADRRSLLRRSLRSPYLLIGLVTVVALVEAAGLKAIQLIRAHFISYFQYKLFNGLILVFAVVLAFAVSLWIADIASRRNITVRRMGTATETAVAVCCAVLCCAVRCASDVFRASRRRQTIARGAGVRERYLSFKPRCGGETRTAH